MSADSIANIIITIQQFPNFVLFLVFLVAFTESLIIIGLLVPGAILMIVFGMLIALNSLDFSSAVAVAIVGAIAGDTLSYWLGKRYQGRLRNLWPLSRHPKLMIRAELFFSRHGVKGIIFSRFIGPLRPLIPAIAGMTRMPVNAFLLANISSAIIWAPLYLLPGILFGLSLDMASEFASKFILLIVLLILTIFLLLWALQRLYNHAKPCTENLIIRLLSWSEKHSLLGQLPSSIFDTSQAEIRGLSFAALIIFCATLLIYFSQHNLLLPYSFDSINRLIYFSLQIFRSPPFDSLMSYFAYIASNYFVVLLCISISSVLILRHNFSALWHLLAAIFLPVLLSPFLNSSLTILLLDKTNISIQPLPSIIIVTVIGFSTMLLSSSQPYRRQKIYYYFSAALVLLISLAQLYYSLQVFSQVLYGLLIGTIWFTLLGIAYRRHPGEFIKSKFKKKYLAIVLLLVAYPLYMTTKNSIITPSSENFLLMGEQSWLESGWELLPVHRQDIFSRQLALFNLQWAGSEHAIRIQLKQSGFLPSHNTTEKFAHWFVDLDTLNTLPVLPHIHQGKYETLRFQRYEPDEKKLSVIRLWPSQYKLKQDNQLIPLWFGNFSYMKLRKNLGLQYLITSAEEPIMLFDRLKINNFEPAEIKHLNLKTNNSSKLFLIR